MDRYSMIAAKQCSKKFGLIEMVRVYVISSLIANTCKYNIELWLFDAVQFGGQQPKTIHFTHDHFNISVKKNQNKALRVFFMMCADTVAACAEV